jgi:hypothetical protein
VGRAWPALVERVRDEAAQIEAGQLGYESESITASVSRPAYLCLRVAIGPQRQAVASGDSVTRLGGGVRFVDADPRRISGQSRERAPTQGCTVVRLIEGPRHCPGGRASPASSGSQQLDTVYCFVA